MAKRSTVSRRDLLKLGGAAATGALTGLDLARPGPAVAETPKRGGTFRIATLLDPVAWDPHQTISFATMTLLSFAHSRLMKVKAGPSGRAPIPSSRIWPNRGPNPPRPPTSSSSGRAFAGTTSPRSTAGS